MDVFTAISLCSGYEGLGIGLKRAIPNIRTICYVENEAYAIANLVAKIKEKRLDDAPIWDDLKTFDPKPFVGLVDIIHSGFPCQPFSVAGKRQGTDDPRHLWPHIERIIQAVEPVWFFGENVSGHLSIGFPEVYRSLRLMGYKVEAGLFTAEEVGAPHKRERLFILANSGRAASSNQDGQISRRARQEDVPQGNGQIGTVRLGAAGELADTNRKRFQEQRRAEPICSSIPKSEHKDIYGWPARPGQPQYEWEEPRVVDDSNTPRQQNRPKQHRRCKAQGREGECSISRPSDKTESTSKGQTQSRLGRTAYGTQSRVDRLRLLGNGVVPQQAELAFRTLIALFGDPK